jgi:hypothetical protein
MNKENIDSILFRILTATKSIHKKRVPRKPILAIIYNNQCLGCTDAIPLAYHYRKKM